MIFKLKISGFRVKKEVLLFSIIFAIIGFVALQIPINVLAGSRVKFTLFDLIAPISGSFLGLTAGIASVLAIQVVNLLFHGTAHVDKGSFIRLVPTIFGVWFFAKREGKLLILPALAILSFNLNPVGRSVWFYSLFWLIPFLVYPFRNKSLVARSLGSTFIAHSVGGGIWIWAFNLPAVVWVGLIPVVILERSIFALGISASYIFFNNVLGFLSSKKLIRDIRTDKKFLLHFH